MGDRMRFIREVVFSLSQTQFGKYMEVTRNTAKYWDEGQINVDKILKNIAKNKHQHGLYDS